MFISRRKLSLWEKKLELAEKTKATVEEVKEGGEVEEWRKEVHRMEIRLDGLKKQCAKRVLAMEKLVAK